jgi:Domain of unknown function (DUF4397)
MKIKQYAFATITLFLMVLAAACGDKNVIVGLGDPAQGARVKFVQTCSNCPTVNIKVGGQLVTGAALGYNGVFPGIGYAVYPAGDVNYEFINGTDASVVFAGKVAAGDNKYYTVFLNDTVPTVTAFVTEDPVEAVKEDTVARIRFVHGLTGKPTKDTLDVVRKIDSKVMFTNITFGQATPFSHLNQGITADSFFVRKAGSTTAYPGIGAVIGTWAKGKTYTIYARGISGRTGTPLPGMTFYTNR